MKRIRDLARKGCFIILYNIKKSIQTALYDLLNKSFTKKNNKYYYRINLGHFNPKCVVGNNFNIAMLTK